MVKYIYKIVTLMIIFMGALFFFGSRLQSDSFQTGEVVEAGTETFPYLSVKSQGIEMNRQDMIRQLMKNTGMSLEEAMAALGISASEHQKYRNALG